MIGFCYSDGGRRAAGFRVPAGDCILRAMAIAMRCTHQYRELQNDLLNIQINYGFGPILDPAKLMKQDLERAEIPYRALQERFLRLHGFVAPRLEEAPTFTQAWETWRNCIAISHCFDSPVLDPTNIPANRN